MHYCTKACVFTLNVQFHCNKGCLSVACLLVLVVKSLGRSGSIELLLNVHCNKKV